MCRQKTNISSQIDLVCKQCSDERQTEITGTENRENHIRLSQNHMRHLVPKTVTMKITVFWNTPHCRLLFTYCPKFYFSPYSEGTCSKSEISAIVCKYT